MKPNYKKVEKLGKELLIALGLDPKEERFLETPRRYAGWWKELMEYKPGKLDTVFPSHGADQLVVVSGMRVFSVCEHHLLPFFADVSIGYIPDKKVLGLSKFARIAHKRAGGVQIQERLVREIADDVMKYTDTRDVAVLARGQHLCMLMRGIKTDHIMTSSVMEGAFRKEASARAEFLSLIQKEI